VRTSTRPLQDAGLIPYAGGPERGPSVSTVFVTSLFKTPMLCVACAQPTVMPGNAAQKAASSIEVSGSSRSGNTVTTEKVSFLLCPACAAARAHQKYRQTHYPGRWWTIGTGLLAAAAFAGMVELNGSETATSLAGALLVVPIVATIAAIAISRIMRGRNDRDNPMSEDDRNRLALIDGAVSVSPMGGSNPTGASLTFKNETFAQAFAAANSPGQSVKGV
jgi:multisubunit Na+/H+ antiporter MnhG subunit